MTLSQRVTTNEYLMQLTGGKLSIQEQEKAINNLRQQLMTTTINSMEVDMILNGIKTVTGFMPTKVHSQTNSPVGKVDTKTIKFK